MLVGSRLGCGRFPYLLLHQRDKTMSGGMYAFVANFASAEY